MTTIECIGAPFTYRWPGGEVHLAPGKPIELPDARAKRLLAKAGDKVRAITPVIHSGDLIEWHRADGTVQYGVVDYIHTDADGGSWAFVTRGESWAAVNLRFARLLDVTQPRQRMA
jgi:hypothetical protein